jgi:hypothetical protein
MDLAELIKNNKNVGKSWEEVVNMYDWYEKLIADEELVKLITVAQPNNTLSSSSCDSPLHTRPSHFLSFLMEESNFYFPSHFDSDSYPGLNVDFFNPKLNSFEDEKYVLKCYLTKVRMLAWVLVEVMAVVFIRILNFYGLYILLLFIMIFKSIFF